MGVNSEMDSNDATNSQESAELGTIVLDSSQVTAMRHLMHELANVLTGVMISGGLLAQYLEGNALRHYAAGVCDGCERGGGLVRQLRSQLLAVCGEPHVASTLQGGLGEQDRSPESF